MRKKKYLQLVHYYNQYLLKVNIGRTSIYEDINDLIGDIYADLDGCEDRIPYYRLSVVKMTEEEFENLFER